MPCCATIIALVPAPGYPSKRKAHLDMNPSVLLLPAKPSRIPQLLLDPPHLPLVRRDHTHVGHHIFALIASIVFAKATGLTAAQTPKDKPTEHGHHEPCFLNILIRYACSLFPPNGYIHQ